jgi:ABC-type lipoprotein release transport system permease subunit
VLAPPSEWRGLSPCAPLLGQDDAVAAVWFRGSRDLRRQIWATLGLIAVVGVTAGLVLAAVAGASRTRSALPRFVEHFRAEDAYASAPTESLAEQQQFARELATVPGVSAVAPTAFVVMATVDDRGPIAGAEGVIGATAFVEESGSAAMLRPLVVDGRLPSPGAPYAVAVDEDFAEHWNVGVGDRVRVAAYSPEQLEDIANDRRVQPNGRALDFEVSGIVRLPSDLAIDTENQTGSLFEVNTRAMYLTPAFWARHRDELATYGLDVAVRLDDNVALETVREAAADKFGEVYLEPDQATIVTVPATQRAIELQAHALLACGAVFGLAAAAVIGQAILRRLARRADDDRRLAALGWTSRQMVALEGVRAAPVALGGALVAVLVAVVLSPLTPIGSARRAETDPGVHANWAVLGIGAIVVVGLVMSVALYASYRLFRIAHREQTARARRRPLADVLARAGAPPPVVFGVHTAVGGRRGARLSLRGALVAALAGVAAASGAFTFGASLDRLLATPDLWGLRWDVAAGNYNEAVSARAGAEALRANPDVAAFSGVRATFVRVDGRTLGAVAVEPGEGRLFPTLVEGELADETAEINVGQHTLEQLNKNVGDVVELTGTTARPLTARITGVVIVPATLSVATRLAEGVTMTFGTLQRLEPDPVFAGNYIVRFADGIGPTRGIAGLRPAFGATVVEPTTTTDIESVRRVSVLPWILALLIGALAAGSVGHALLSGVRREQRDLAMLKTLGFSRSQIRWSVATAATTFGFVALLVGIPLGLVVGRLGWERATDTLGIVVSPVTPVALLLLVPVVAVVANLLAAIPGRTAARINPATALRAD